MAELVKANSDAERIELLDKQIAEIERAIFALRYSLAIMEGRVEGLMRLRETLGTPKLSAKHTLRGRIQRYLETNPSAGTSEIASSLCTPVTTVSMCLNRNKNLFEKVKTGGWANVKEPAQNSSLAS